MENEPGVTRRTILKTAAWSAPVIAAAAVAPVAAASGTITVNDGTYHWNGNYATATFTFVSTGSVPAPTGDDTVMITLGGNSWNADISGDSEGNTVVLIFSFSEDMAGEDLMFYMKIGEVTSNTATLRDGA